MTRRRDEGPRHTSQFRYKQLPLRRHFLSQIGQQILTPRKQKELLERLYTSYSDQDVRAPQLEQISRIAWIFAAVIGIAAGFAVAAAFLIATAGYLFGDDPSTTWWETFVTASATWLAALLAPAALVGGLAVFAGKTFQVTRFTETPSTDEQFETEFRWILKKSKANRLVVFTDELDRCAPGNVVDVLDTVRTFLDARDTVFVVAADQQVLENAHS